MRKLNEILILVGALAVVALFSGVSVFAQTTGQHVDESCSCVVPDQSVKDVDCAGLSDTDCAAAKKAAAVSVKSAH